MQDVYTNSAASNSCVNIVWILIDYDVSVYLLLMWLLSEWHDVIHYFSWPLIKASLKVPTNCPLLYHSMPDDKEMSGCLKHRLTRRIL